MRPRHLGLGNQFGDLVNPLAMVCFNEAEALGPRKSEIEACMGHQFGKLQ